MPANHLKRRKPKRWAGCLFWSFMVSIIAMVLLLMVAIVFWPILAMAFPHQAMWVRARLEAQSNALPLELDGLVVDGQGVPIPDATVHLTIEEPAFMTSSLSAFEKVQHQETTDAAGRFSFRGEGRQIRVIKIDGPGEWLYDLDVGTYVTGEPNRSNAIYKGGGQMTVPYRVKPDFPAVFVLVSKDQPIAVMPQRGGNETLASGKVMDNGPVFPRRPSIPFLSDPAYQSDRDRSVALWVPPRTKPDLTAPQTQLENEIGQRLRDNVQIRTLTGPLTSVGSPTWKYRQRLHDGKDYRRLSAVWHFTVNSVDVSVTGIIHLTPEGFRPVYLYARPKFQPPIPLWTKDEVDGGIAHMKGTTVQRDTLFKDWETDGRASINVIEWMAITRPVTWPYQSDASAAAGD